MKLDVQVRGKRVAQLYREGDEYVLKYLPAAEPADFVSLAMPVEAGQWRWPRDLHPFFRQNLPEGFLLEVIREEFGPLLGGEVQKIDGGYCSGRTASAAARHGSDRSIAADETTALLDTPSDRAPLRH